MNCETFVFIKSGGKVTPEFCAQCPHNGNCNNNVDPTTIKRLLIEDKKLLKRTVVEDAE